MAYEIFALNMIQEIFKVSSTSNNSVDLDFARNLMALEAVVAIMFKYRNIVL